MRPLTRRTTIAAVLVAGLALAACDAVDGDLAPSAATGIGSGDVAASAWDGDITVTTAQLEDVVEVVLGSEDPTRDPQVAPQVLVAVQQQSLQLLVQEAVFGTAAEEQLGIVVSEEDVDARFDEIVEEAGGREALDGDLAAQGLTAEQLRLQLPLQLLAGEVAAALAEDGEQSLQQWATDVMVEADPAVARRFGRWDPTQLQVVPADQPVQELQAGS